MATTELPAAKKTPIEIRCPVAGVNDHGLALVRELGGAPRNYLHTVTCAGGNAEAEAYLSDAGYCRRGGWRAAGRQWWEWAKEFDLIVAGW